VRDDSLTPIKLLRLTRKQTFGAVSPQRLAREILIGYQRSPIVNRTNARR